MIYNMDCRQGSAKHLQDNSIDLMITDPPYNLAYGGTVKRDAKPGFGVFANDNLTDKEFRRFTAEWLREAYRVLKPGRHIYVFIDWRSYPLLFWLMQHTGFIIKNCIVWDKVHMGLGWQYRFQHELIIFAAKEPFKRRRANKGMDESKIRRIASRSMTDVWSFPKLPANRMLHPTEKPLEIMLPMIRQSSLPGETIADFFVGRGPVAKAAFMEGRKFVGFEINEHHYLNATARIQQEIREEEYDE